MKAAGYIRVSSDSQVRDGVSLEQQENAVRRYASAHGFELVAVVADRGLSGTRGDRPGFVQVMDMVRRREIDVLVCYSLSRFGRSTLRSLAALDEMVKRGVGFVCTSDGGDVDMQTPAGRLTVTVKAGVAQYVRDEIAQKTRDALQFKKQRGERVGSVPRGYRVADDGVRLVVDDDEQQVVSLVQRMRRAGNGLREIARQLTRHGITNTRTGRQTWHAEQVRRMLAASKAQLAVA